MARPTVLLLGLLLLVVAAGAAAAQEPPEDPTPEPPAPPEAPEDPTPDPPDRPGPVEPPQPPEIPVETGSSEDTNDGCASTDDGETCHRTHRESRYVEAADRVRVTLAREDRHVVGSHNGDDGSAPNQWEDHERTREVRVDVEAGPAPATVTVTATGETRSHRQTDETERGTNETRLEAGVGVGTDGPLGVDAGESYGMTYRESFAGDGYHRCEVDADGPAPAVGTTCPGSLADDTGIPPGGPALP
jgi:hypothetical protein